MPVTQPDGAITTLATGTYVDAIFSADSSRLYAASGNILSVIDVASGAVLAQYTIGTELGAIDVSVDGRFLAVVEQQPGSDTGTVYRIDLTTGDVTSYSTTLSGFFFDVSFLADGTVLLSQSGYGSCPLRVLDFSTSSFTTVGTASFGTATLTASADANEVSVQPPGYTEPSYVYTTGVGITADAVSVEDPYAGASLPPPGEGVSAISPTGDLIIQAVSLNVYDGALNLQFSLRTKHPYLGGAEGMAFSPDGRHLYVLLGGEQGQLVVLNTSTWEVVGGYRVGSAVPQAYDSWSGEWRGYGNLVQVSGDGNYVSVIGTNGVQLIDVSLVRYESTQGADDVAGSGLVLGFGGDDVLTATGSYSYARLLGGAGNDSYHISGWSHYADEYAGEGHDTVYSTVSHGLGWNFEDLVLRGSDPIGGSGNELDNSITGNAAANELGGYDGNDSISGGGGDDILIGGNGTDVLDGGQGSDIYMVDAASEHSAAEFGDTGTSGTDEVRLSAMYDAETLTLRAGDTGIERIAIGTGMNAVAVTTGTLSHNVNARALGNGVTIVGNDGANRLLATRFADVVSGNAGDDVIAGYGGVDQLDGGEGSDLYLIASAGDHSAAEFSDTGWSGSDEVRFAAVGTAQMLTLFAGDTGIERIVIGTGTSAAAVTSGTLAHNVDARALQSGIAMLGNDGANVLQATSFSDVLSGGSGDDRIYGYGDADVIDGGIGVDRMYGGAGDDSYLVDNSRDVVGEGAGNGSDIVEATCSYTIRGYVENLTLIGTLSINGRGNAIANVIIGNSGANRLFGENGNDRLVGYFGNDVLDGGAGADHMDGGGGNDIYYVNSTGDTVVDDSGNDLVYSSISYALGSGVERLTLTGASNLSGTGNALANSITGNGGANTLRGGAGNDTMSGGAGADRLYGHSDNDVLKGGDGNDWIEGGAGRDRVSGGTGADSFSFRPGDFAGTTSSTPDVITDFSRADGDTIRLEALDANRGLAGDQAFTFIGTSAFGRQAGEFRYEQIGSNTFVMGDVNGDGTADFRIQVDGLHALTSGDFVL